jgi:hypothetical protein
MKNLLKICVLASLVITMSCNNEDEEIILDSSAIEIENFDGEFEAKDFEALEAIEISEKHKNRRRYFAFSKADVINPILGLTTGKSKLIRGRKGIYTRYRSNNLIAGHAYTLWLVIWNRPENCATPNQCNDGDFAIADQVEVEVLFGGSGRVVGKNGKGTFYGRLKAGDVSESINDLFGLPPAGGLQKGNTFPAEVHLVLRSHGPAIPGMIHEQISSYVGGCTDPFAIAPFTEIPDAVGECGDIEFSLHAPVN